jgi:hypothetical protein
MTMLKELISEFVGMFVGDAKLTLAILAIVAGSAILVQLTSIPPLAGGAVLLFGMLALLIENVWRAARTAHR